MHWNYIVAILCGTLILLTYLGENHELHHG